MRSYKGGPPKCPDVAHFLFLTALPSVNVISSTYFSCIYLYYLEKKKKKKTTKILPSILCYMPTIKIRFQFREILDTILL